MEWLILLAAGMAVFAGPVWASAAPVYEGIPVWKLLAGIAIGGALIGLGRLLVSGEKLTLRLILGRSIVSGGLAVAAGAVLTVIPNIPVLALCGLAAACAVLGEQFLERLLNKKAGLQ